MTPCERLNIGAALWAAGDALQRASARRDFPDADDDEINFRLAVTRYGAELARKALPKIMTPASDVFALLRGALEAARVRYAIGGSWASTAFGEPRFTNDVDILAEFTAENIARFLARLPETFFADAGGNPADRFASAGRST